ncbi:MAG: benzoate-CoA ligase family protein [Alphaproteobacteria bacterium]|nr:benzoate-CoA ligase family protein [Alphaproteobacteria bacterium]
MPDLINAADAVLMPAIGMGLGDKPALISPLDEVTYSDLCGRVCQAAHMFADGGLEIDGRVVLMVKDGPDFVTCYLGAIKAGGVAVAINLRGAARDLHHVLDDSDARFLIIDDDFLPLYESIRGSLRRPPEVIVTDTAAAGPTPLRDRLATHERFFETVERRLSDMAFWIYTSGTTGASKAAVHGHRDVLLATAYATEVLGITQDDTLFGTSKLFFAYTLGTCLFASLQLGATTLLYDGWPDSAAVARLVESHRPTVVFSVPTMYRNMLADGVAEQAAFNSVRHCVSAGERLPESLWHRWHGATGIEILDGMGTTETIYMLLSNRPAQVKPGSSGIAAPEAEVRLADADGRDITAGEPGILWARIQSRCSAYWGQPDISAEVFRGDWFRTGDMYVVDREGYWFHQGRYDDMLKISGQWVSPAEIEDLITESALVRDAALVATETDDELLRTTLFAVAPDGGYDAAALEEKLRSYLVEHLSPYKCPKWIKFIDEIPRTATGKVQRYRLRGVTA